MTSLANSERQRAIVERVGGVGRREALDWYAWSDPTRRVSASKEAFVSRPLRVDGVLCPLDALHAKALALTLGVRLPTREEALRFAKFPHIPIQTLPYNSPEFATEGGALAVSRRVDTAREVNGITGICDNESKMWIQGASPGWALLVGFFNGAGLPANTGTGAPGKPGYGPKGEPHNDRHVDYSMAPVFVWE